jgi:hypothetical protein
MAGDVNEADGLDLKDGNRIGTWGQEYFQRLDDAHLVSHTQRVWGTERAARSPPAGPRAAPRAGSHSARLRPNAAARPEMVHHQPPLGSPARGGSPSTSAGPAPHLVRLRDQACCQPAGSPLSQFKIGYARVSTPVWTGDKLRTARARRDSGDYDVSSIAKVRSVSRASVYRALAERSDRPAA